MGAGGKKTALAPSAGSLGAVSRQALGWVISIPAIPLGMQELRDLEGFATMVLDHDLLARHWVPYGDVYPRVETGAGVLLTGMSPTRLAAPAALFIGAVGAASASEAVFLDARKLGCACVGGGSHVPLGAVSPIETLTMMGMAVVMLARLVV